MRIRAAIALLALSTSACGLFTVTVNGKTRGPGAEEASPSGPAAESAAVDSPTKSAKTAASDAEPAPVPVERIALPTEVPQPVVLSGGPTPREAQGVPIEVTSTQPRKVSVYVVGGWGYQSGGGSRRLEHKKITADEPFTFEVKSSGDWPWHVVVVDDKQTMMSAETSVYGHPKDGAPIRERVLSDYSLFGTQMGRRLANDESQRSPTFAAELFAKLDERFFVFVKEERRCNDATGPLLVGEPLLLDFLGSGTAVDFRRANGERARCYIDDLDIDLTTERPSEVVLPPAVPPKVRETQNLWRDEEFLSLAESNARIAAYVERKKKTEACFDREWDKHDPDGVASRYDYVKYDSRGRVKKVEGMADRIQRKVDKKCKIPALEKERAAIRDELRKQGEERSREALRKVAARFGVES